MVTYSVDVPLLTKLSDRALAAGKIQRQDRDTIVQYAKGGGHSTEQLLEQLGQYLNLSVQRKTQAAKDAATAVANGQRDAAQKLLYAIQQSSGAPLGSPGRVSFDQATLDAAGGDTMKAALLVVTGKGKATVTADPAQAARGRFLAQLAQARKTQNYKALFSTNTPGFDPVFLTPGELAYWRKTRSNVHDERQRAETLSVIDKLKYGLLVLPFVGWVASGVLFGASAGVTVAGVGAGAGGAGLVGGTVAGVEGAGAALAPGINSFTVGVVAPNTLGPSAEIATARNAREAKQGEIDEGKGAVTIAATVAGAFAGIATQAAGVIASVAAKVGIGLAQTGANYGLDVAAGKKGAEAGAIESAGANVLGQAGGLAGGAIGGEVSKTGAEVGASIGSQTGKLTAQGLAFLERSQAQDKGHGLSQLGPRR